jgi:hypothetical protein
VAEEDNMVWGGTMALPSLAIYAMGGLAFISTFMLATTLLSLRSNKLMQAINAAMKGEKRLVFVHYASGQCNVVVPQYIEPKETDGMTSPYWVIDGTYRFKDATGEKWESLGSLKILHYTARTTQSIGTDQAVAIDQFNDLLANHGYSTKGFLREVFYMLSESAKGDEAEKKAWRKLQAHTSVHSLNKINEILTFLKEHEEIKYVMLKTGAFTYKTAVSVVDQLIGQGVTYLSHTISFVEDKTRRSLSDRFDNMMKYAMLAIMIMIPAAIAGVIFLVGSGMVKM